MTKYQTRHSGSQHRSGAGFHSTLQEAQDGVGGTTLSLSRSETKYALGVDEATAGPSVYKRIAGKYLLNVFDGSGFLAKAENHLGLRGHVLDTNFGPRYDVAKSLFSPEFDKASPLENVSQESVHFRDNTLRALPKLSPPVRPSQT